MSRKSIAIKAVPLVLDLWAYGCSATAIAYVLGLSSAKVVTRIVAQARLIGDPRAVVHWFQDGRPAGRPGRIRILAQVPGIKSAHLVKNTTLCHRGHRRTKRSTRMRSNGKLECRICDRLRKQEKQRDYPGYRAKIGGPHV